MDIAGLIASFKTGTYTVTRSTLNGSTRGVANPPTITTFPIDASVQPANGRDLLRLPEGRRSNETRVLFTTIELLVGDINAGANADKVGIEGDQWEVQHVETWRQNTVYGSGTGYRCIVQSSKK